MSHINFVILSDSEETVQQQSQMYRSFAVAQDNNLGSCKILS